MFVSEFNKYDLVSFEGHGFYTAKSRRIGVTRRGSLPEKGK